MFMVLYGTSLSAAIFAKELISCLVST